MSDLGREEAMSDERIDLAGLSILPNNEIAAGDIWIGNSDAAPSLRLLKAFARGEVTKGGMAEAGWQVIGTVVDDGWQNQ